MKLTATITLELSSKEATTIRSLLGNLSPKDMEKAGINEEEIKILDELFMILQPD